MVCMYFTTVCMPVCIPVCTVCMACTYTRLNLGCRGTNLPRATLGGDERVDVLGRLLFPRRLGDEI